MFSQVVKGGAEVSLEPDTKIACSSKQPTYHRSTSREWLILIPLSSQCSVTRNLRSSPGLLLTSSMFSDDLLRLSRLIKSQSALYPSPCASNSKKYH